MSEQGTETNPQEAETVAEPTVQDQEAERSDAGEFHAAAS